MSLTNGAVWNTYAGGVCAASDKNSYDVFMPIGRYMIQPVSAANNVERHVGYNVWFLNEKGKLEGGLWQSLSDRPVTLRTARRLCQEHLDRHAEPVAA